MKMTDADIEHKAFSEVVTYYQEMEYEYVAALEFHWSRVSSRRKKPLPNGLKMDSHVPHVYFEDKSLLLSRVKSELALVRTAFLYTEDALSMSEGGPVAMPDDYAQIDWDGLSLEDDLPAEVESALVVYMKDFPDVLCQLVASQADPDSVIDSFKSKRFGTAFKRLWAKSAQTGLDMPGIAKCSN